MYIVELTYTNPFENIEAQLQPHRDFLDDQYGRGAFLVSGPKNPRDGGIIIASGKLSRNKIERVLKKDPFYQHELADYRVTEFLPNKYDAVLSTKY
ncbi:GTP cyclohydrolase [Salinisphaera sp. USBA-960]|uniref:YciI family protein n=1 Tax=Salinisphaera orenii TaxID=856731 RepID=UPI000DBEA210|nr:GTP cyclohydrolase [Salifodinibacter halophilus]NNC26612.1 GTP cyclohydrolase [Salifodinibacter halophilus]